MTNPEKNERKEISYEMAYFFFQVYVVYTMTLYVRFILIGYYKRGVER